MQILKLAFAAPPGSPLRHVAPAILLFLMFFLSAAPAQAGGTLTVCSEFGLDLILRNGGLVELECGGEIVFSTTKVITNDTVIAGNGMTNVTFSGGDQRRLFEVAEGVTLTLRNVRLARGRVETDPGRDGTANSPSGRFAAPAMGAAILNTGGNVIVENCTFANHQIIGGAGGTGYTANACEDPGSGGAGGDALGAAIFHSGGQLTIRNSTFDHNEATGGAGGDGGGGGTCGLGSDGRPGRAGGEALGVAVYVESGTVTIESSTFFQNSAAGGAGGKGGDGTGSLGAGDDGGRGGNARGAAIYNHNGQVTILNGTVAANTIAGGDRGDRGIGVASGKNGSRGNPGRAEGAGLYGAGGTISVQNTILTDGLGGDLCAGTIADAGHNLSSDASCSFLPAENNEADPLLSVFANHGGLAETLVPVGDSPAIDAADTNAAPSMDQRSFARVGPADIGAAEAGVGTVLVTLTVLTEVPEILEADTRQARYRVIRSGTNAAPFTVYFTWQGDAVPGEDFTLMVGGATNTTRSIVVPAGTNLVDFLIRPIDDDFIEPAELIKGGLGLGPYNINPDSDAVSMTILASDPRLLPAEFTTTDGFTLSFLSSATNVYAVEASTNLVDWQLLTNLTGDGGRIEWRDPESLSFRSRFYRLTIE